MGALLATQSSKRKLLAHTNPRSPFSFHFVQAAKFGRGFLDFYNPTDFVNMGQTLKVLNAVRYYEIGIPLTYGQ